MTGYRVNGRYVAFLGAAIALAVASSAVVYRGHQVVWS